MLDHVPGQVSLEPIRNQFTTNQQYSILRHLFGRNADESYWLGNKGVLQRWLQQIRLLYHCGELHRPNHAHILLKHLVLVSFESFSNPKAAEDH